MAPGVSFSFEITEKQGAALVTKDHTYRADVVRRAAFEEYTKRHYISWVTFARNKQHGSDIKPVLISGIDMTREFAMMAYSNNGTKLSSTFTISVPLLASASASVWGKWETQGIVHTNCGPQICPLPPLPAAQGPSDIRTREIPKQYNQCVFIRYYTMRWRALMFPKVMKAAAGPHDLGPGNNHDETLPELTMQSNPDHDSEPNSEYSPTDHRNLVTSHDPQLEIFNNTASVRRLPYGLLVLTSP